MFDGTDQDRWITRTEVNFEAQNISKEVKLNLTKHSTEGSKLMGFCAWENLNQTHC